MTASEARKSPHVQDTLVFISDNHCIAHSVVPERVLRIFAGLNKVGRVSGPSAFTPPLGERHVCCKLGSRVYHLTNVWANSHGSFVEDITSRRVKLKHRRLW